MNQPKLDDYDRHLMCVADHEGMIERRRVMAPYLAIGILDGFEEAADVDEYIDACRYIRDHGPRGVLAGNGTNHAVFIADLADHDYDMAVETIHR